MANKDPLALLRSLESYGYQERVVPIGDVSITLAPLGAAETIEVFESTNQYEDTDASIQKLKLEAVARSIIKVNDISLDPKGMLEEKQKIVGSFGDELIDILFDEYCQLDKTIKASVVQRESAVVDLIREPKENIESKKDEM